MGEPKLILSVKGMTCSHCQKAVEQAVSKIKGVKDVSVDLAQGLVTVAADNRQELSPEIKKAIEEAGYTVEKISGSCC